MPTQSKGSAGAPRLLVIGEAVIDVLVRPDGTSTRRPGGSPANVALALGRLGHRPRLLTAIGRDEHGSVIRDWLAKSSVEIDPHSWTTAPTSTVTANLDADGMPRYDLNIGWSPGHPQPGPVDLLHVGSISATMDPGDRIVGEAVSRARHQSALISYDPNIRAGMVTDEHRTRAAVLALIRCSGLVKLSDEDLAWIVPGEPVADAARALLDSGPAMVVVTEGGAGASAHTRGGVVGVAAPPTAVADTIGAGDTLMAAMLAALIDADVVAAGRPGAGDRLGALTTRQIDDLLGYAVAAAAITVSRVGADPPWKTEMAAR